jgi:hypothetical protein
LPQAKPPFFFSLIYRTTPVFIKKIFQKNSSPPSHFVVSPPRKLVGCLQFIRRRAGAHHLAPVLSLALLGRRHLFVATAPSKCPGVRLTAAPSGSPQFFVKNPARLWRGPIGFLDKAMLLCGLPFAKKERRFYHAAKRQFLSGKGKKV